jgi:hypothetical protein
VLVFCVREVEGKHTISMTAKDDDAVDSLGSSSAKEQSERKGLGIHDEDEKRVSQALEHRSHTETPADGPKSGKTS